MLAPDVQATAGGGASQKVLSPVLRISLLLGVCVHLAGFLVFRVISNPLPTRDQTAPFVQYVSPGSMMSGPELEEQAVLFDSAPLFIPGRWNAAHNLNPPSRDRVLLRFPSYDPEMDPASTLLPESLPLGQSYAVREPMDLLALRYWDLFRGFALGEAVPVAFEATGSFAEVRSATGRVLSRLPVALEMLSTQAVQPVSYFLRVEASGRVLGRPTLSASSGDSAFDAAVYTWLIGPGVAARLPVGFLEIRVYP